MLCRFKHKFVELFYRMGKSDVFKFSRKNTGEDDDSHNDNIESTPVFSGNIRGNFKLLVSDDSVYSKGTESLNSLENTISSKEKKRKQLFEEHYKKLMIFVNKNEKLPSYYSANENEKHLACWCAVKRSEMRSNKLENYAIDKLNEIKLWSWGCTKNSFDENFKDVKKWIKNNNDKIPSYASKDKKEKKMAMWCNLMKRQKKEHKLSDYRIKKLETIKNWLWICNNKFEEVIEKLKKWVKKNKKMPKLNSDNDEEKYLAKWCSNKRYKKNKLEQWKVKDLERIDGWIWTTTFEENVINYNSWTKKNKTIPSIKTDDSSEKKLAIWKQTIKHKNKKNELSNDNKKILELYNITV